MKPIDILLIIICIYIVYLLINDYINLDDRVQHFKSKKINKPKQEIYNSKINIEKLDDYDYYPITLNLSNTLSYIPDDCLPLNFQYDPSVNTLLLNGSCQIVATDASLNSLSTSSKIKLNLILSNLGQPDVYMSISNLQFTITQCKSNPSITITNIPNSSEINLLKSFRSINGNITIGLLTFPINEIIFNITPTLATLFNQNPKNQNSRFVLKPVCSIASCNTQYTNLSPIIPASLNPIDELIQSNTMFALYAKLTKKGIPSNIFSDPAEYKVYLSITLDADGSSNQCGSTSGMLKFTNNLTQGSIFNVSKAIRRIPKLSEPYKYIDFYNVLTNTTTNTSMLESTFYNLSLVTNKHSLTYCTENCDQYNNYGFCGQENPNNNINKQSKISKDDQYSLKNYMKFKFESDGSVTPYFIYMYNDIERIYFITNKYNSIDNDIGYKTPVQVPIYNNGIYYEMPDVFIQNSISFPTVKQVPLSGFNSVYTEQEKTTFNESISMSAEETKAFLNDAYTDYSISFFIEKIDPTVTIINKLPLNE